MKRWNFGGLRATHGVSISHRSIGSTGGRQDPGKTFKNKKMPAIWASIGSPRRISKWRKTDVERGLILVEGAVPGSKGGWIAVRDAVKKPLPKDAPMPGKFRVIAMAPASRLARPPPPAGGGLNMKFEPSLNLEGKAAGSFELNDAIFGLEPRKDLIQRVRQLAARQAPRRHAQGQDPRRDLAHRQEDVQAEGHRRRPSRLGVRVPQFAAAAGVRSGRARSHEFDLPKKVRALALRHALSAKAKDGG
jgi:hypothetical protein